MTATQWALAVIERSGLTRAEIARIADVSEAQLSRFVRGETSLTLAKLDAILDALRVSLPSSPHHPKRTSGKSGGIARRLPKKRTQGR
jgi:transcriptional regulator with XRE-family HTH domain